MRFFVSAFVAFIIVFPIYLISSAFAKLPSRSERAKQIAISRGHVVTAKLKKKTLPSFDAPGAHALLGVVATYEYEYKGKTYRRRISCSLSGATDTCTLYFLTKPRRARLSTELSNSDTPWAWIFLAVALFVYLIIRNANI